MAGDLVSVHLTGGSPWGFRLYGGEGDPLIVAKVTHTHSHPLIAPPMFVYAPIEMRRRNVVSGLDRVW